MRKIGLVATAILSLLLLTGAPAAYATDLPDVPVGAGVPSAVADAAGTGASHECTTKSSMGPNESQPKSSRFCVLHSADNVVKGYLDFYAPAYDSNVAVFYDLFVYRCRVSDNVCVEIDSASGTGYTDAAGLWDTFTPGTTQNWTGRYYKACAAISTGLGWGYGLQCTSKLIP